MRKIIVLSLLLVVAPLARGDVFSRGSSIARFVQALSGAPANAVEGVIYENTTTHDFWFYDGTAFRQISTGAGTAAACLLSGAANCTMTGAVNIADGTASVPSLGLATDVDGTGSGLFRATTNAIGFASNGTEVARLAPSTVGLNFANTWTIGFNSVTAPTTTIGSNAAATLLLGLNSATPVAQTVSFAGARNGTDTNIASPAGGSTIQSPLGTGTAVGDQLNLTRGMVGSTGTAIHTTAHAVTVCESKTLSTTSATTTTIATVGLATNTGGGFHAIITLVATDGTNFDSETQDVTVSYVNKAAAITIGGANISASTQANNSGSATIGATVTGASPTISLKVTPVFTTIVPTTVTSFVTIFNNGAGAVACQ